MSTKQDQVDTNSISTDPKDIENFNKLLKEMKKAHKPKLKPMSKNKLIEMIVMLAAESATYKDLLKRNNEKLNTPKTVEDK